jgi:hypothetical protein
MTNDQSRGSLRAALQAGGWKRPVQGFTLRYVPLMLAVAAAGCDRPRAGGQEGPNPGTAVPTVSSTVPSRQATGAPAGAGAITPTSPPAPGPAAKPRAPRPVPVAAPLAPKAPATVARAGTTTRAVVVELPVVKQAVADLPDGAAPTGTEPEPLLVTDAERKAAPGTSELDEGELDGLVLAPGAYAWSTDVSIPVEVTLAGEADDVWIFRIAKDLVVADHASVTLSGGARAGNVLWLVAGRATLGAGATVEGTIESPVPVSKGPGAVVTGSSAPLRDLATPHAAVAKVE